MRLPPRIQKSADAGGKAARLRSPSHLAFVRGHQCSVAGCDQMPIEAAHVRCGTGGGMGMKPGDDWTISLCRVHHAEQHQIGERAFEQKHALDMKALAQAFAEASPALRRIGGRA